MTNFENIKTMSIDELAEWLAKYESWEDTPWIKWFNNNYCDKCDLVVGTYGVCLV